MLVLGIETSCDETAAAVVAGGQQLLSSVISSQIEAHKPFGGVVPEIASREHLNKIVPVVTEAVERAGVNQESLDGLAVTVGPGLIGSLLVGVSYAKAMAYALGKPIVGVNHLEGHIYSVVFENPPIEYPAMALIVSGGHTNLFLIPCPNTYRVLARTRDDAAGEAFDKVSKMLGFAYPGGPIIEQLALDGNARAVPFSLPRMTDGSPDFSFSGLKTAASRYIKEKGLQSTGNVVEASAQVKDLAASFQSIVVRYLVETTERLVEEHRPRTLIVAGGVACNTSLRESMFVLAERLSVPVQFPSRSLSTDNAAMIAAAGTVKLQSGERAGLDLNVDSSLRLQNTFLEEDLNRRGRVHYRL